MTISHKIMEKLIKSSGIGDNNSRVLNKPRQYVDIQADSLIPKTPEVDPNSYITRPEGVTFDKIMKEVRWGRQSKALDFDTFNDAVALSDANKKMEMNTEILSQKTNNINDGRPRYLGVAPIKKRYARGWKRPDPEVQRVMLPAAPDTTRPAGIPYVQNNPKTVGALAGGVLGAGIGGLVSNNTWGGAAAGGALGAGLGAVASNYLSKNRYI